MPRNGMLVLFSIQNMPYRRKRPRPDAPREFRLQCHVAARLPLFCIYEIKVNCITVHAWCLLVPNFGVPIRFLVLGSVVLWIVSLWLSAWNNLLGNIFRYYIIAFDFFQFLGIIWNNFWTNCLTERFKTFHNLQVLLLVRDKLIEGKPPEQVSCLYWSTFRDCSFRRPIASSSELYFPSRRAQWSADFPSTHPVRSWPLAGTCHSTSELSLHRQAGIMLP